MLTRSPFLSGVAEDARRVALGADGTPELLNSVVDRDPETGVVRITAPDQATLDKLITRERDKAEAAGRQFAAGEQAARSDKPQLAVTMAVVPGRWQRMAAKASLALLAEVQPPAWRLSASADRLCALMHDLSTTAAQAQFLSSRTVAPFALPPATAITAMTVGGRAILNASLLGIFTVRLLVDEDLVGADITWVSDPLDPARSFEGPLAHVIYERHRALGYL